MSAQAFIERVASFSSATGEPYRVKLADGAVIPARDWMMGELRRIEAEAPPGPVSAPTSPATSSDLSASATTTRPAADYREALAAIRASPAKFLRVEDDEAEGYSGAQMASHLTLKYRLAGRPPLDADEFITRFATQSSRHGTDYLVEESDGRRVRLADWLRARLTDPPHR